MTGGVLKVTGHILVHPEGFLSGIDIHPEMFEHPLFIILGGAFRTALDDYSGTYFPFFKFLSVYVLILVHPLEYRHSDLPGSLEK